MGVNPTAPGTEVITSVIHSLDTRQRDFFITGQIHSARSTERVVFVAVSKTSFVNTKPVASAAVYPACWNVAAGTLDQLAPDAAQGTFDLPCFFPDDKKLLVRGASVAVYDLAEQTFLNIAIGGYTDWKPLPRSQTVAP
ncbi:MAG: hypothetical protein ABIZ04_03030 [Opitutus sp.]